MPEFVKAALKRHKLLDAYNSRPPYQKNDYLWWIKNAKREDTKQKRLQQMLNELKRGNVYMKMKWRSRTK